METVLPFASLSPLILRFFFFKDSQKIPGHSFKDSDFRNLAHARSAEWLAAVKSVWERCFLILRCGSSFRCCANRLWDPQCDSHELIATLLYDFSMSALPSLATLLSDLSTLAFPVTDNRGNGAALHRSRFDGSEASYRPRFTLTEKS